MKETQIIHTAEKHFRENTGLEIHAHLDPQKDIDGKVEIINPETGRKSVLFLEVKYEVRTHDLQKLKKQCATYKNFMLITQYISGPTKDKLRHLNINYLESSGNCYVRFKDLLLYVNDRVSAPVRKSTTGKLYTFSGMKFIYAILLRPEMLLKNYRDMSKEAGIALGSVSDLVQELKTEGFVRDKNDERQLVNRKELFELWVDYYDEKMVPHLLQDIYVFADRNMNLKWESLQLKDAFWGGEPAAYLLDHYLKPETFTIFSSLPTNEVAKRYRLIPSIQGNVTLMRPPLEHTESKHRADPFLIYAELMCSNDSRCHEAAERIREKYIEPQF